MPSIDRKEIEKNVKEILAKELGVKIENITLEKRLVEDLGMDSFASVELLFEMEDRLEIEIPEIDARQFRTVEDVIAYITSRIQLKNLKADDQK